MKTRTYKGFKIEGEKYKGYRATNGETWVYGSTLIIIKIKINDLLEQE